MKLWDLIPPEFRTGGVTIEHHMEHGTPIVPGQDKYEAKAGVALPGDPVEGFNNRFIGMNPQRVHRLIRSGMLPPHLQQKALDAIKIFEGVTAEATYLGSPLAFKLQAEQPDTNDLPAFEDPVANIWDRR